MTPRAGAGITLPLLGLALLVVAVFALASGSSLSALFSRETPAVDYLFRFSSDVTVAPVGIARTSGQGLHLIRDGAATAIALGGVSQAQLLLTLPPSEPVYTLINLSAFADGKTQQTLSIVDGARSIRLSSAGQIVNRNFDVSAYRHATRPLLVRLDEDDADGKTSAEVTDFSVREIPSVRRFPAMDLLGIALAFLVLIFRARPTGWLGYVAALLGALAAGVRGIPPFQNAWFWFTVLGAVVGFRQWLARQRTQAVPWHEPLLIPMALALIVRWKELRECFGFNLGWSDAETYRQFALAFDPRHPWATNFREPLMIWAQYVVMALFGPADVHIRLLSMGCSLLIVAGTYVLAWCLSGRRDVAWLAALMTAFSDFLTYISALGGRNDLYTALMLVFCAVLIAWPKRNGRRESVIGILGGLLAMTWLVGGLGAALAYLWRWRHKRIPFLSAVCFYLVLGVSVTPNLLQQWTSHHDPLYSVNFNTREFEQLQDGEAGPPPTSWWDYVWHHKGVFTLGTDVVKGYATILFNPTDRYNKLLLGFHYTQWYSYLFYPFLLLGVFREVSKSRWAALFLFVAFVNLMPAFLKVPHPRLFLHAAPFYAYFWAVGMASVIERIFLSLRYTTRR